MYEFVYLTLRKPYDAPLSTADAAATVLGVELLILTIFFHLKIFF